MLIFDEQNHLIAESEVDLTKGYIVTGIAIREEASPVDNVSKFAWACDDYVTIQRYILFNHDIPSSVPSAQDDTDAMLIDHEYRLTLLELGLTESEV